MTSVIKQLRKQIPSAWSAQCYEMTVQHYCPNCGGIRKTSIQAGVVEKQTLCMACGALYALRRSMHVVGLVNKRVVK